MPRRVRLLPHPQSGGAPALEIEVEVTRDAAALGLTYIARGDVEAVALPQMTAPARADDLWQHTCFEAFVRSAQASAYWEFNFSPSREWAAYRFGGYREGMTEERAIADTGIHAQSRDSEFRLSAKLNLSGVKPLWAAADWQIGLSAIIEDENGDKSWWALAHYPEKPDFHHPDTFVLNLPRENR